MLLTARDAFSLRASSGLFLLQDPGELWAVPERWLQRRLEGAGSRDPQVGTGVCCKGRAPLSPAEHLAPPLRGTSEPTRVEAVSCDCCSWMPQEDHWACTSHPWSSCHQGQELLCVCPAGLWQSPLHPCSLPWHTLLHFPHCNASEVMSLYCTWTALLAEDPKGA